MIKVRYHRNHQGKHSGFSFGYIHSDMKDNFYKKYQELEYFQALLERLGANETENHAMPAAMHFYYNYKDARFIMVWLDEEEDILFDCLDESDREFVSESIKAKLEQDEAAGLIEQRL